MARVSFIITIELDRGQKHLNFILSMGLSLPDAGIPVSHHSLSWRQHHITTGEDFLPLPHLITFMLPLLSPDCKLLLLTMCELMEPYFRWFNSKFGRGLTQQKSKNGSGKCLMRLELPQRRVGQHWEIPWKDGRVWKEGRIEKTFLFPDTWAVKQHPKAFFWVLLESLERGRQSELWKLSCSLGVLIKIAWTINVDYKTNIWKLNEVKSKHNP